VTFQLRCPERNRQDLFDGSQRNDLRKPRAVNLAASKLLKRVCTEPIGASLRRRPGRIVQRDRMAPHHRVNAARRIPERLTARD
jgi:hypothetical protein